MEEWQPSDIREAIGIQKQRMEYLKLKVGITADLEQSDTPGRSSRYSFRNAVQFAIAEELNRQGVKFEDIKKVLSILDGEQPGYIVYHAGSDADYSLEDALNNFYLPYASYKFFIIIEPYTASWSFPNIMILPTEQDMAKYVSEGQTISTIINPVLIRNRMIHRWEKRGLEESLRKEGITKRRLSKEETKAFLEKFEDNGV